MNTRRILVARYGDPLVFAATITPRTERHITVAIETAFRGQVLLCRPVCDGAYTARQLLIASLKIGDIEQLVQAVPSDVFATNPLHVSLSSAGPGEPITLAIRNQHPVPLEFYAELFGDRVAGAA